MRSIPAACATLVLTFGAAWAEEPTPGAPPKLEPIQKVEIGEYGEFRVNGKPFFPVFSWLQGAETYPRLRALGFNVFMGNWQNTPPADEMGVKAQEAGGYAIPHFDGRGFGHPGVFAWVHGDEPDITSKVSDAKVTPGPGLKVNRRAPLTNLVDGNPNNSAAIDPMADASFTVELAKPVAAKSVAVWLNPPKDGNITVPSEIAFLGDGKELLKTAVEGRKGEQKFDLPAEATFQKFEVRVTAVTAGKSVWGLLNEIAAYDAGGANILKSEPKGKVRQHPDVTREEYEKIKAADPSRPVFLTLTVRFLPRYEVWHKVPVEEMRPMYPKWAAATDVLGTDIYPIYGFNKPEWLLDNIEALKAMRQMAGPKRPLYIWIETCNGGQQQSANNKVTPRHTRAEVWMSIIAGARAIGYFTHAWKPSFRAFAPDKEMQTELARLNGQIARLAPAILAKPAAAKASIKFDGDLAGHLMATDAEDATYIFAQNLDVGGKDALGGKSGKAVISLEGLKAGTKVEVVDENRTIQSGDGSFEDTFEALAEHVYRIARP